MAIYKSIAAWPVFGVDPADTETEIEVVLGDWTEIKIKVKGDETETEIKDAIEAAGGLMLDDLFVHVNRDGSVAVATGAVPDIWPEDEIGDAF